jgi:ABC-2 type transport system permease protein
MTFALQTRLFFRRKLLETLRQPVWLVTGLTTPLLYLALFAPLLRSLAGGPAFPPGQVLDVFVPGILVLIAFGAGMGAGWPVIWELDSGVIERLRVTPASRFALLLGTVLRDVAMFAVPGVVVMAIAAIFGFHAHWGGLAVLLVLLALLAAACSATSSALGLNLKQIGSLAAVVTGVQLPLTLLSGILLPLSLGPEWLRVLGHLNPMYYAVQASRSLAGGAVLTGTVALGFLVTGAAAALALWWGTRSYQRAMALSPAPGTVTAVEIMTSAGPAHAVVDEPAGRPRFLAVLTHGAGGTPDTPDVLAVRDAARGLGAVTALVTQPYRVRGGRAPGSAARQDAAWAEIVAALSDSGLPLVQGGRSNGARVACRTARQVGAAGVIALAFPLHPPRRPGQPGTSRDAELRAAGTRVLVLNGDRDPFGIPEPDDATRVVVLPGETHALSKNPAAIGEAVARWLGTLPGIGSRPPSVSGQAPPR